jgi:hypothetical protein
MPSTAGQSSRTAVRAGLFTLVSIVLASMVALVFGMAPPPAHASWSTDPLVNLPLCSEFHNQSSPRIVADGLGGWIVVWVDQRAAGAKTDIYAQRVDSAGNPLWAADGVPVCSAANDQIDPSVLADEQGGVFVAWTDLRSDALGDIYAQRLGADGQPLWDPAGVPVATSSPTIVLFPSICGDGAGGVIVTWIDRRFPHYDLYGQRLNGTGQRQWAADGLELSVGLSWSAPRFKPFPVVGDGAGGAFCAMSFTGSGGYDLRVQRVGANGARQWGSDGTVACPAPGTQKDPVMAPDGAGGVIVAWTDLRSTPEDIYAQRLSVTGAPQWGTNGAGICTAAGTQDTPAMTVDGATGCVLVWRDFRGGSTDSDIYAQRVDASGAGLWGVGGSAVCQAAQFQVAPAVVPAVGGGWLCAWQDLRAGPGDVYIQKLDSGGGALWDAGGVAVCTAPGQQSEVVLEPDLRGGATLAWTDARPGAVNDIYAQRVSLVGTLFGDGTGVDPGSPDALGSAAREGSLSGGLRLVLAGSNPARTHAVFQTIAGLAQPVELAVFDLRGRRVCRIFDGDLGVGRHAWLWDGRDAAGERVATGVYRVRLRSDRAVLERSLVLIR